MRIASPAPSNALLSEFNDSHRRVVTEYFSSVYEPVAGIPHAFSELEVARDGTTVLVVGSIFDELVDVPRTEVYSVRDGAVTGLSGAAGSARSPRISPDGRLVAYRTDSALAGVFQVAVTALDGSRSIDVPAVDGTVEFLDWNPSGDRLLVGVAGLGAEQAGRDGSGRNDGPVTLTNWAPSVESVDEPFHWRRLWVLDVARGELQLISPADLNVWEAQWCGPDEIVAVTSPHAGENWWYSSRLTLLDPGSGRVTYPHPTPRAVQVGVPVSTADGMRVAFIQGVCSDRGIIAGDAMVLDRLSGEVTRLVTSGTDVARMQWVDDSRLGFVGLRGMDSVVGTVDLASGEPSIIRSCSLGITGAYHPTEAVFDADGATYFLEEGYAVPQRLVRRGTDARDDRLLSVDERSSQHISRSGGIARAVTWTAPDGLELEGVVCSPDSAGPFPTILLVHGGPVIAYRDTWAMGDAVVPLLVSRGYAVFCPNPRGSAGRGQDFVRRVVGDMGGAETADFLSGIDHLVRTGLTDPSRVGVMGCSYGGFMTAWLVTQDARFSAAVIMSPATDWLSQTFTSSLPSWTLEFLTDDLGPGSLAHVRSPALNASRVATPCVVVGGAQDLCTPSGQSREFHRAVQAQGVESTLVIYPLEGHGVQAFPAVIDHLAGVLALFARHLPAAG